jgi:hypothetical protein
MNQYFFKMSQAEKNNILDQHKTIYDGYVTNYNQESNTQPLYVQDFANDKEGITVSNKGVVKKYTNMGINESHLPLDKIADGPTDLKHGTIDIDSISDMLDKNRKHIEDDYISLGVEEEIDEDYEFDIDETDDFMSEPMNEDEFEAMVQDDSDDFKEIDVEDFEEIDEEELPEFMNKLNESLTMFRRMKNYN